MNKRLLRLTAIVLLLALSACSSDDSNPSDQPIDRYYFRLVSNTISQFIVYSKSPDGTLFVVDYENGNTSFTVRNGDIITVVCKIGEELLPTVSYRIDKNEIQGEIKTLFSSPNTSGYSGFRLMRTQDGQDNFTIQY